MMQLYLFVVFICSTVLAQPSYIKPCRVNSGNFNKCALENGNYALPYLLKGDPKYNIPPINPLKLPLIEINDRNLDIVVKDVEVLGFNTIKLTDMSLTKKYVSIVLHADLLNVLGQYTINGSILVLPISGNGPINITAVDGDYKFTSNLRPYQKRGETYLTLDNPKLEIEVQRAYFKLDNLFNGDEKLGAEINKFLNENWQEVLKELGKPLSHAVVTICSAIVENFLKKIPASKLFLE